MKRNTGINTIKVFGLNYISLLGAFQALVVLGISIVFAAKEPVRNDRILSWLLACIFVHLTGCFVMNKAFPDAEIHKGYSTFIVLLYAPLLWLYARQFQEHRKMPAIKVAFLFIPAGLAAIAYFTIAGYVITHGGKTPVYIGLYNKMVGWSCTVSYIFFGIKSLNISQQLRGLSFSEKQLIRLIATIFIGGIAISTLISLANGAFPNEISATDAHLWIRIVSYTMLLAICLAIGRVKIIAICNISAADISHGHLLLAEPALVEARKNFVYPVLIDSPEPQPAPINHMAAPLGTTHEAGFISESKQKKSSLSDTMQAEIIEKVNYQMVNEKLYTDADLSLDGLAVLIKVPRHHLSESLNKYLGKSFYQYINEYRIQHVIVEMERLREHHKVPNILSIAFEAGFNSKSSFNQYFKKTTGITPSGWLKNGSTPVDDVIA
ncbi:MAG: AraC family transcriptional regulator [Chitinophaga sp.]|uniref:helix-turn-helix domain-containing protein n=1 Tax=Chitinophaga sp. TaxID=1869181 RepID=UPI001B0B1539|nr:helix-turn-helix domain-containing protein [Chitinophaga sp.]MBO9731448.1 AraC family transcriptional regulator [Chitinophaga sp.]